MFFRDHQKGVDINVVLNDCKKLCDVARRLIEKD
jgi:hypothetical protein